MCHSHIKIRRRIVGGENARIMDFPWQVSIQENFFHLCGASIINENRILTAAHCFQEFSKLKNYSVIAGSADCLQEPKNHIKVIQIAVHPNYNNITQSADIAVLWLGQSVIFNQNIRPVRIPDQNQLTKTGTIAHVAGWGYTSHAEPLRLSRNLKFIELQVISNKECQNRYNIDGDTISSDMICAESGLGSSEKDSMVGDSGGPLVIDDLQIGIVSWARYNRGQPGVYTRISIFSKWIRSVI